MFLFYVFLIVIGLIGFIAVGLSLSNEIENSTLYMLFWMLYSITFITFINIILTFIYYQIMKKKKGAPGKRGPQGDEGEMGKPGTCEASCRDNICINAIKDDVRSKLKQLSGKDVSFNNIYLHQKIKQMCGSPEFKQTAPFNGPTQLITYLGNIWKDWTELLYNAGGSRYFETLGAENQWEWVKNNPFDEMKKYDVFYWGMDKSYRPKQINECSKNITNEVNLLKVCKTNNYTLITNTDGIPGKNDASFWRPKMVSYKGVNYYPVGDIVIGPSTKNDNITAPRYVGDIKLGNNKGPNRETILVSGDIKGPLKYELLWDSSDIGSNQNIYVWRPIGPKTKNGNYIALGDVITIDPNPPLTGVNAPIRCINEQHIMTKNHNGNILWSSEGSGSVRFLNILGFKPNNENSTQLTLGNEGNAYNLFRGVKGNITIIPNSDKNAQFYTIKSSVIDVNGIPGKKANTDSSSVYTFNVNEGDVKNIDVDVNLGYQKTPQQDSKYSILPYLKLKSEGFLKHKLSNKSFKIKNSSNTQGNTYLITVGNYNETQFELNNCLAVPEKLLSTAKCLSTNPDQYFKVEFTGNEKDQCRIKSVKNNKFLIIMNGYFQLVKQIPNKNTKLDPSIFYLH